MKKSDLKTGMLVQTENNDIYMIINDYLIGIDTFDQLSDLNESMIHEPDNEYSIARVSKVMQDHNLIHKYWTEKQLIDNLLWDRKESKPIVTLDGVEYSAHTLRSLIKKATE